MAVLTSTPVKSSLGRLSYLIDEPAHNGTDPRALAVSGSNVKFLHDREHNVIPNQSGEYFEAQFKNVRKKAYNPDRHVQAQSVIVSFSDDEMPDKDRQQEAKKAVELVGGYAKENLPKNAQWVAVAQRDNDGNHMHVHLIVNAIQTDGKTVQTSNFSVNHMRKNLNTYLKREAGFEPPKPLAKHGSIFNRAGWLNDTRIKIKAAAESSTSVQQFKDILKSGDILVVDRNEKGRAQAWSYTDGDGHYTKDFYVRKNMKTGEIKSYRGLGEDFTPEHLMKTFEKNSRKTYASDNTEGLSNGGLKNAIKLQQEQTKQLEQRNNREQLEFDEELEKSKHDKKERRYVAGRGAVPRSATKRVETNSTRSRPHTDESDGPEF